MVYKSQSKWPPVKHDEQVKKEHENGHEKGLYTHLNNTYLWCVLHPEIQVPPAISSLSPEHLHKKR